MTRKRHRIRKKDIKEKCGWMEESKRESMRKARGCFKGLSGNQVYELKKSVSSFDFDLAH